MRRNIHYNILLVKRLGVK